MSNAYLDASQQHPPRSQRPTSRPLSSGSYDSYASPPTTGNYAHQQPYDRQSQYGQPAYDQYHYSPQDRYDPIRPLAHENQHDIDEPFDVRADFDGDGPRWSELYGPKPKTLLQDEESGVDYKRLDSHVAPSGQMQAYAAPEYVGMGKSEVGREELVSVPVLGPEWKRSELHELSRRGQSELRSEKRTRTWNMFKRDQGGLCGIRWMTRRLLVFGVFFFLAALGVTLFFVIPRAPTFTFYEPQPFTVDNSTIQFSRTPTNFSFAGNLNLYADSSSNYLPVNFKHLQATVYDLTTTKIVATGDWGSNKLPKGKQEPVILPVTFSYSALNASDATWVNVYDACGHLWTGTTRPDLKFRLELRMSIWGLINKPISQTQISDVTCPFELPGNSV